MNDLEGHSRSLKMARFDSHRDILIPIHRLRLLEIIMRAISPPVHSPSRKSSRGPGSTVDSPAGPGRAKPANAFLVHFDAEVVSIFLTCYPRDAILARQFRRDLWHPKTRVPGLLYDVVCVMLFSRFWYNTGV